MTQTADLLIPQRGAWEGADWFERLEAEVRPSRTAAPAGLEGLTSREVEILALIAEGLSNAGISHRLYMSPRTVEAFITTIFRKLGVHCDPGVNRRVVAAVTYLSATAVT